MMLLPRIMRIAALLVSLFAFAGSISISGPKQGALKKLPFATRIRALKNKWTNLWKKDRSDEELKSGIARFYDESSSIWLDVWGEHMHHGYYPTPDYKEHQLAQVDMIDRSIDWAYGDNLKDASPKSIVDVGCGVGGSSRHILKRFGMETGTGISLSPFQISKANEFTANENLSSKLEYKVADAMNMPFQNGSFDLTWSMESGEHMPDKDKFMNELVRVTAPGGRIIVVTWCHRELKAGETDLSPKENSLLDKINDAYYLPKWVPASRYVEIAKRLGLEDIRQDDWSEFIAPFWPAVFRSALVPKNFFRMLRTGWTTIKGAIATLWMLRGFQKGVLKFALITGRKPAAPQPKPFVFEG